MCPRFFTQMDESVFSLDVIGRSCQVQSSVAIIILTKRKMRKMILLCEKCHSRCFSSRPIEFFAQLVLHKLLQFKWLHSLLEIRSVSSYASSCACISLEYGRV